MGFAIIALWRNFSGSAVLSVVQIEPTAARQSRVGSFLISMFARICIDRTFVRRLVRELWRDLLTLIAVAGETARLQYASVAPPSA